MKNFLKKTENKVLLLLFLSAIFFIYLFFYDLNKKIDIGSRTIIGSVEFKNNIVQRKLNDHMVWESLKKNSPITNRDTIRSDSLSDALIRLNDGTVISMDENSMFYLDISSDDPTLDLASGNINIKKSNTNQESLKIKSADSVVSIQDGELNLNKSSDGMLTMHVEKGDASITNKGKTQNITSGNQAEIQDGNIQISKIPFVLNGPVNNKIVTTKESSNSIDFIWKPVENYNSVKLELSRNSDFSNIVKVINYPKQKETIDLPLGSYYWRLNSDAGMSAQYRFHILKESQVNAKVPMDDVVLTFVEKLPSVSFQWNSDPLAKDYVLEISDSKKFEKLSSRHTTKSNSIAVDNLNSGEYFWRVKSNPITDDLPEKKTPVKRFKIEKASEFPVPSLVRPLGSNWGVDEFQKNGFFAWESSHELIEFHFQLAKDSKFAGILIDTKSQKNFFKPSKNLGLGTYYWRVKGFSASGKNSSYSKTGTFTLIKDELVKKESINVDMELPDFVELEKENKEKSEKENEAKQNAITIQYPLNTVVDLSGKSELVFEWENSGNFKDAYIFTLWNEESGKKKLVYQVKTKATSYTMKNLKLLDEGKYSWEISLKTSDGKTLKKAAPFVITLAKLRGLNPGDIEFISPTIIYKEN